MEEYVILFYQNVLISDKQDELRATDSESDSTYIFKCGDMIIVDRDKMFKYLQLSHNDEIKICIYLAKMVIDFS